MRLLTWKCNEDLRIEGYQEGVVMHDSSFFSHWGFSFGHWSVGILLWIAVIILVVVLAKAVIQKNNNWMNAFSL